MRTIKSKISALVLGVCLLVSLALGGVAALAATSMNHGTVKVTVTKSTDATFVDDLRDNTTVVVDLYKIGDATPSTQFDNYDYTLDSRLGKTMKDYLLNTGEYDYEALSADAAKSFISKVSATATATKAAGQTDVTFTGVADGIYLVDAHGNETYKDMRGNETNMARSPHYMYKFTPYVIILPTKGVGADGKATTSDDHGEWLDELEVGFKPARFPRYGALKIVKKIDGDASDEDSTFVFHLWGKTVQGQDYDNYASVTIPAGMLTGETTVDHIPAGTNVNIEEVYTAGSRYKLKSLEPTSGVIIADDNDDDTGYHLIEFTCVNEPGEETYGNHGVENNFEFKSDYQHSTEDNLDGTWEWDESRVPEDKIAENDDPDEGDLIIK